MKKYALVRFGIVQSTFYSDANPSEFPDIEPYLMEVSDEVKDNWPFVDGQFIDPGDGHTVAEIKPWWKLWA